MKRKMLQLEGREMLTKDQMKMITGGVYEYCIITRNSDCGGGSSIITMTSCSDDCSCQQTADDICAGNNCCDDADCGCKGGGGPNY